MSRFTQMSRHKCTPKNNTLKKSHHKYTTNIIILRLAKTAVTLNVNLRVQCQRKAKLNDIEFRIKEIKDLA